MVVVWWLCGGCVVIVWWLCGGCVVVVWWLCGGCVVVVWWLCGGCVVVVWWLCGGCVVVVEAKTSGFLIELGHICRWKPREFSKKVEGLLGLKSRQQAENLKRLQK